MNEQRKTGNGPAAAGGARKARSWRSCGGPMVAVVLAMAAAHAHAARADSAPATIAAGTSTRGGLVADSQVQRVTSLADGGPGSLRQAVAGTGPRVVVFDVAGVIELERDLRIDRPFLTVAGQTAPAPGIVLRGAKLRISTHDVVLQHLSIRPGRLVPAPNNADGVSIGPCSKCRYPRAHDIVLENLSVGWAADENIGLWGDALSRVTVKSSLIAEGLNDAGHAKGDHSMGMLVGTDVQAVEVVGNLFVSNMYRNPVIGPKASAFVANNYIVNPGRAAMHLYRGPGIRAAFVGNVVREGPDTDDLDKAFDWQGDIAKDYPGATVFARDNHCCDGTTQATTAEAELHGEAPTRPESWTVMPVTAVTDWVLRHAGARPAERNPIDARVVASVENGTSRIIDDPASVGGYGSLPAVEDKAAVPPDPFAPARPDTMTRLEAWLCLRHLEVGGAATGRCAADADALRRAIDGNH